MLIIHSFYLFIFLYCSLEIGKFLNKYYLVNEKNSKFNFLIFFPLGFSTLFFSTLFVYVITSSLELAKHFLFLTVLITLFFLIRKKKELILCLKIFPIFLLTLCFFSFFNFFLWQPYDINNLNVYDWFGSLHTNKNLGIYFFMEECNLIPFLNQDYSNSLITLFFNIFKINEILAFNLTLSFFQIIFTLIIFSFFIFLKIKNSLLSTFVLLFSSTTLSSYFFVVNDSGFPLVTIGYANIYIGLIFGLFLIYIGAMIEINNIKNFKLIIIFGFLMLFIFSPHFFIILFIIFLLLKKFDFYLIILLFIFTSLISLLIGGFFSVPIIKDFNFVDGAQVFLNANTSINIMPFLPYKIYDNNNANMPWNYEIISLLYEGFYNKTHRGIFLIDNFIILLKLFLISCFVFLYPFFSIFLSFNKKLNTKYPVNSFLKSSFLIACIMGFFFSFPFEVNSYKWELSRFNLIWVFLGLILLIFYIDKIKLKIVKFIFLTLLVAPYFYSVNFSFQNINLNYSSFLLNKNYSCNYIN
jgi:hypothetical protein